MNALRTTSRFRLAWPHAVLLAALLLLATHALAQSPPGTVGTITVTRGNGTLTATWDAPANAAAYHVTYSTNNGASWSLGAMDHTQTTWTLDNGTLDYLLAVNNVSINNSGRDFQGLSFDADTRTLSGTPSAPTSGAIAALYYVEDDAADGAEIRFTITIDEQVRLIVSNVTQTAATLTIVNHTANWWYQGNAACEPVAANTVTVTLANLTADTSYTYKAYGAAGCNAADELDSASFKTAAIAMSPTLASEDDPLALVPDQRYVQSVPIDPLTLPAAPGGGGDSTYTLTPAAPPGLTFDAATRTLTGTPTRLQPPTIYTYQTTAANGLSTTLTFAIEIVDLPPTAVGSLPDVQLTPGDEALPVEVADAFSGTNLVFAAASSDPTVATVAVSAATVSVAPVAAGEATVTVTARNSAGEAAQSFAVTVAADPAEAQAVEDTLAAVGRGLLTSLETTLGGRLNGQLSDGVRLGGYSLLGDGAEAWRDNPDRWWLDDDPEAALQAADQMPDWLGGTSFALAMNDPAADGTGRRWTLWGQGDVQTFSTREETVIDGEVQTVYLGLDARLSDGWLLGGALAYSASTSDYSFAGAGGASGSGHLETTLVNLYPYAHKPLARGSLWAVLGVGNGSIRHWRSRPGLVETGDLSMLSALAGGRHELLATAGGIRASLLGSLASLRLKTAAAEGVLANLTAAVHQMRVGLESSYEARVAGGGTVSPFGQVSLRHDAGDGVTGSGLEVSGGVRYHAGRLSVELGGRLLAAHVSSGYEESGWHAAVRLEPRASGEGLSLSVSPTWGLADHRPVEALWSGEVFTALDGTPSSAVGGMQTHVGYGLRLSSWSALLTPYVEHASAASGDLRTRVGVRLEHDSRFRLDVRGEHLESAGPSAGDRGIFLEVGLGL